MSRRLLSGSDVLIQPPEDCNVEQIIRKAGTVKRRAANPGRKDKPDYLDLVCAIDIETSVYADDQADMYVWMMQLGLHEPTIVGRTWDELSNILERIRRELVVTRRTIVFWVHNLCYEFQFFRRIFDYRTQDVFAVKKRKVLRTTTHGGRIECRCSYLHTNMSLDTFTAKMGAKHGKLSGEEYDYSKRRYQDTPLTDRELLYCVHDVLGLVEALTIEMEHDGDTLDTVPATSTGYVRREMKRAMRAESYDWLQSMMPDYDLYLMLSEAFRGGNTHANRWCSGHILHDIVSYDRVSSYPSVMVTKRYPVQPFRHLGPCSGERLRHMLEDTDRAFVARVAIHDIALLDQSWGCPYLSISKIRHAIGVDADNGRVLSADYLETTITDIDLRIILEEYGFSDIVCEDCYYSGYGTLPKSAYNVIMGFFEQKTQLKGVKGSEILYEKAKNKLNACYGMAAQDPVKRDIIFDGLSFVEDDSLEALDILAKSNRKGFYPYQWGVWTTAHARYELEQGIKAVGDAFVYCDTDSVKCQGRPDFGALNARIEREARDRGVLAVRPDGQESIMGVWELDGEYDAFVTLGAKKYAYEDINGLHVTVAGVSKKYGAQELARAGRLRAFRPGFTFVQAGGTESVYNDEFYGKMRVDNREIIIGPNVAILPSTYTLGVTAEYERLLQRCRCDNLDVGAELAAHKSRIKER